MGVEQSLQCDKVSVDKQMTIKVSVVDSQATKYRWQSKLTVDLQAEKVTVVDLYGRFRNNLMNPKLF